MEQRSTNTNFDAIVIGGGHNGLAAAATLARKGKRVCVLERASTLGGMMAAEAVTDGVDAAPTPPRLAHLLYNLNPKVERELGLRVQAEPLTTVSLSPTSQHVQIDGNRALNMDGSAHAQATAFSTLHDRLTRYAGLLSRLAVQSPPKLEGAWSDPDTFSELLSLGRLGLGIRGMGKREMREFLRVLLTNVHDLMVDELGDGPLAGAMSADAVRGAFSGPKAPGTLFSLLYRLGNGGGKVLAPVGGMGAVVQAFEDAATRAGCVIKCEQGVERVLVENDRVQGVELTNGERLNAKAVLSSLGPMATIDLAGLAQFDVETVRRSRKMRAKGSVAKLNMVLSALPVFSGLPTALHGARLLLAPSSTYVERAFNPVKYGESSQDPCLELFFPNAKQSDQPQALSALVSFVPHTPAGGEWTTETRDRVIQRVVETLEPLAPGIKSLVQQAELLTPADIEAETGSPGGHWHHGEMGIDQILNVRPINGMAHYSCGVAGLYLCGASAHPGGDITGAPGRNSALQALKDGAL